MILDEWDKKREIFTILGLIKLVEVKINDGESFESFLRRFTKRVQQESIISEARRRQHFESFH